MVYKTLAKGVRRTFTITVGLREGYGDTGIVHHPDTADRVVSEWMEVRVRENRLTISGFFTEIKLHYARTELETAQAGHEPGLRFWGEVSIQRLEDTSDAEVIDVLDNLADTLGEALRQEHVIVSYRNSTWVREYQAE